MLHSAMLRSILLVLVLGLLLAVPVGAQEIDPVCDADFMGDVTRNMETVFNDFKAAMLDGDTVAWLTALRDLRNGSAVVDSICKGFHFEGEGKRVLGPVVFPDGVYKATVTAVNGTAMMTFEEIAGDCDLPLISTDSDGGTSEGALTMEGCQALIEVIGGADSWTLDFELIVAR